MGYVSPMNETFTAETIARMLDLAGEGYTWEGVRSCGRPTSKARAAFRNWLADAQGYVCPQCGDAIGYEYDADGSRYADVVGALTHLSAVPTESVNFAHIVPRGPKMRGWLPGNVFVAHARCNGFTLGSTDHAMTFDMFKRPDAVYTGEWPSMTALVRNTLG